MDITEIISKISEEMGIELEGVKQERYGDGPLGLVHMSEVLHNGEYYGFLVLGVDKKGEMNYCSYTGKHPVLFETKDWRDELGLSVERDDNGLFRVDTNQTNFLGFERVSPNMKYEPKRESLRTSCIIGFGAANCYIHNHKLKRAQLKAA